MGAEVERVAGGGGHRHGDAGDEAVRRVVQVPGEDPADVGALDDAGEAVLLLELEHVHGPQERRGDRRVVHRDERAVRSGCREDVGEPVELGIGEVAVVIADHARVERDDPQAVHVVDAVLRRLGTGLVEQALGVAQPLVMVAHDPDDLRAHPGGDRFHDRAQPGVRLRFALVREVAREDERLRTDVGPFELAQRPLEVRLGVDRVVELAVPTEEVGVADVGDGVRGRGVLSELGHVIHLSHHGRGGRGRPEVVLP